MANLTELKSKTLGNIAAIQTLLERYPILITTNSLKSISGNTTSFDFMFDLLQIIGVDNSKLVEWASNLLVGDGETGVLDTIETVIKTALKLNIKNVLSCTVNPIIPDDLLDYHQVIGRDNIPLKGVYTEGAGIEIDLGQIDFTGMLKIAPTSSIGKYYYFDNEHTPNNLFKSRDFNGFLWYCINKGLMTSEGNEKYKMMWDNRNKIKIKKQKEEEQNTFYNALIPYDFSFDNVDGRVKPSSVGFYNDGDGNTAPHIPKKKQILQCQFVERSFPYNNKLKVQLCSSTYYKTRKLFSVGERNVKMNKTIFEFNNDYIDSLKLFDSKVLMAQIVDKLTGSLALNVNYSINEIVTQGKIDNIIKKIIEADDTNISDCFYTFSNEEYDKLLQTATLKHAGLYKFSGDNDTAIVIDSERLLESLTGITENSTLQEKNTTIKNTFTEVSATLAQDGSVSISDSFGFGMNIVFQMIHHIMSALIGAILSPKVMILLAINMHIMGNDVPKSFDELFEGLGNLIITIIKEIKDVILNELYNFLMEQLTPLIELFVSKLALETIKFYKELLTNLLEACFGGSGNKPQSMLDNVNYADIVPQETTPDVSVC